MMTQMSFKYDWSGEGLQVAGKKQPIPCRQGFPPGGAPGGRLQRARHTRNKDRFTLFSDGLPAGPPGAPAAGQTHEGIQSSWSEVKGGQKSVYIREIEIR